jgi:hypothetical protein
MVLHKIVIELSVSIIWENAEQQMQWWFPGLALFFLIAKGMFLQNEFHSMLKSQLPVSANYAFHISQDMFDCSHVIPPSGIFLEW